MADADSGGSAGNIRFDDIVARVVADPAQSQGATLLAGFIGKGDADDRVRIYPDLTFGSWYDVAAGDIVHSIPLPKDSSPLGGSYVWVKGGAEVKSGPAAQPQAAAAQAFAPQAARPAAAAVPFSLQQTCGIACTAAPQLCPPPPPQTIYPAYTCGFVCNTQQPGCTQSCTLASTTCPQTINQTCPPCTVPSTLCPTVDVQTCPPQCQPTMIGNTCPNGDCTFFGTCPPSCPQHARAAAFAAAIVPTAHGATCPRFICTETIPPTRHVTCPPHICTETIPPAGGFSIQICAAAAAQPTPTATFFHTCMHCGPVAHPTPTATFFHTCMHCGPVAHPTTTTTFDPTLCTQCFICPPFTAPQTRTGVFNPLG